jgi:hypothetical protein
MKKRSALGVVISKSIGFLIFLILLALANYLKPFIPSVIYSDIVNFFIDNIGLSFIIYIASMIAGIFWSFVFPFNIIAPIASAVYSLFLITYFLRMWIFINQYVYFSFTLPVNLIYRAVFWLVIIFGYIGILTGIGRKKNLEEWKEEKKEKVERVKRNVESVDWSEIGEQFKLALYNLGSALKNAFEPKKKQAGKKRK